MAKIRKDAVNYSKADWSKSLSEISKELGCSYTSLLNYAKKNGIAFIPGDPTRKKPDWSAIEADYKSGMDLYWILKKYKGSGISERILYRRAAKWDR